MARAGDNLSNQTGELKTISADIERFNAENRMRIKLPIIGIRLKKSVIKPARH